MQKEAVPCIKNPPLRKRRISDFCMLVIAAAGVGTMLRCLRLLAGFAAAFLADPVKYGAGGVNVEAVILLDMMRDLMQVIAVQMNQRAAFRAFEVKM